MVKWLTAWSIFDQTWHVLKVLLSGFAVVAESSALFPKGEAGSAILLWKSLKICIFAWNLELPWGFLSTVLTRRKVNWLAWKIIHHIEANVFWERVEPWMRTRLNSYWKLMVGCPNKSCPRRFSIRWSIQVKLFYIFQLEIENFGFCCKAVHFSFGLDLKPCHDTYHGKATQLNKQQNISSKDFPCPFWSPWRHLSTFLRQQPCICFCFVEQKTHTKRRAAAMHLPFSSAQKSSRGALSRPCWSGKYPSFPFQLKLFAIEFLFT